MRKPTHSQGKSSTPWEENGNSNIIHFLHLDKERQDIVQQVSPGQMHGLEKNNPEKHWILHLTERSGKLHATHNRHFSLFMLSCEF